jgi:hypothetical protein
MDILNGCLFFDKRAITIALTSGQGNSGDETEHKNNSGHWNITVTNDRVWVGSTHFARRQTFTRSD